MPVYRVVVARTASPGGAASGGEERTLDLDRELVLVGRRTGADVQLPDPAVAPLHVRLEREGDDVFAVDAGAGETRIAGVVLEPGVRRKLADGDELVLGGAVRLRYVAHPTAAAPSGKAGTADLARAMVREVLGSVSREGPGGAPVLRVTDGPAAGTTLAIPPPGRELVIGRGEACDATLVDSELSREHVRVRRDWEGAWIEDLGSKNGTRVGDEALAARVERRLRHGDVVRLGPRSALVYEDPAEALLARLGASEEPVAQLAIETAPRAATRAPEPAPGPVAPRPQRSAWLPIAIAGVLMAAAAAGLVYLLGASP